MIIWDSEAESPHPIDRDVECIAIDGMGRSESLTITAMDRIQQSSASPAPTLRPMSKSGTILLICRQINRAGSQSTSTARQKRQSSVASVWPSSEEHQLGLRGPSPRLYEATSRSRS